MNSRRTAYNVLLALQETPRHLETLLEEAFAGNRQADVRDRGFCTHLVYAVLRHKLSLQYSLAACLSQPWEKLELPVRLVLLMAAAEIMLLRTPDHAAVHSAVDLSKKLKMHRASGLINAVLRRLARQGAVLPGQEDDPALYLALVYSHPLWLVQRWLALWPYAEVQARLQANQEPSPTAVRFNSLALSCGQFKAFLSEAGLRAQNHPLAADSFLLSGKTGPVYSLPGFAQGFFQPQDPGATAVGHLLGVRPGARVLDMCAGIGGKTSHLYALMVAQGRLQGQLYAVEPSTGRAKALRRNLERLGCEGVKILQQDARLLAPEGEGFDYILLDAPCSGLGVLGRRPDLRWRRQPEDLKGFAAVQWELAAKAVELLKPGGVLLYVTCTALPEENETMVLNLLSNVPGLKLAWQDETLGYAGLDGDGFFRTHPQRHKCDGFFAARLLKQPA